MSTFARANVDALVNSRRTGTGDQAPGIREKQMNQSTSQLINQSTGNLGRLGKIGNGGFFKMGEKMTPKYANPCPPKTYGFCLCSQLFPFVPNRSESFPFVPNRSVSFRIVPFCSVSFHNVVLADSYGLRTVPRFLPVAASRDWQGAGLLCLFIRWFPIILKLDLIF